MAIVPRDETPRMSPDRLWQRRDLFSDHELVGALLGYLDADSIAAEVARLPPGFRKLIRGYFEQHPIETLTAGVLIGPGASDEFIDQWKQYRQQKARLFVTVLREIEGNIER